jgi:hypothetical protein
MVPGQDESDPDDDADDKADYETKTGGVTDGTLAEVKDSRRLIFVHALNLHRCLPRTTGGMCARCFSAGCVP